MIARLLISTSQESIREKIEESLKQSELSQNHPDVLYFPRGSKLGIEQSRQIKEHFSFKPHSAKGKIVVLEDASTLTPDAQNSLLKTLEELPTQALFIMGAKSDSKLLPTVLSRCQIIRLQNTEDSKQKAHTESGKDYTNDIEKLISLSTAERFGYVEKLKEKEEFLHALTQYFHKTLPSNAQFLKELLQGESWANQNVNIRAILEYLMLVMPSKE